MSVSRSPCWAKARWSSRTCLVVRWIMAISPYSWRPCVAAHGSHESSGSAATRYLPISRVGSCLFPVERASKQLPKRDDGASTRWQLMDVFELRAYCPEWVAARLSQSSQLRTVEHSARPVNAALQVRSFSGPAGPDWDIPPMACSSADRVTGLTR